MSVIMSLIIPGRFSGLTPLLAPRSVAVLGASSDPTRISGRPIAYMKSQGFQGGLYPINPNRTEVQGLKAYASINDVPEVPDVAIVAVRKPHWTNASISIATMSSSLPDSVDTGK